MNEMLAAVMIGLLLSVSAGVRALLPLLAVNLLAYHHVVTLPASMTWLGTEPTLIILGVATIVETLVHFIPVAGTGLKAIATPLAFAAGTLLMAVPFGDKNPLVQWTLAAVLGGGTATLTHVGVTGLRALTEPANVASAGIFGIFWNIGEFLVSILFTALSFIVVVVGWVVGAVLLAVLLVTMAFLGAKSFMRLTKPQPV